MVPPGGQNWHYCIPNIFPRSQECCVKISLHLTKQLWRYTTWQVLEGLLPSVASKCSSLITSSHGSTWPSRSNCCSDSSTHETSKPAIDLTHDPILWLEHHRTIWWFPAVLQISGKLVHPSEYSNRTTPGARPDVEPNFTQLEYVLNFLGNTGHRKFDHWKLTGTADEISRKKKQASAFMDYLSSMMDHAVSQCCRIYQLEDVRIWPGESPDELVDHLRALADWCNFPSDEEKEQNIQYRLVRALNDKELVKKLLTLDLMATTPKMLEVCQTHCHLRQPWGHGIEGTEDCQCHKEAKQITTSQETSCRQCALMWTLHKVPPTWPIFMPSMGWHATDVKRKDTGSPRTRYLNTTTEEEDRRRSMKLELMKTPIMMRLVLSPLFCRHHLTQND